MNIEQLILKEGWEIRGSGKERYVHAYAKNFPLTHPVSIHLKLYREEVNPELKYYHMKAAHDYLWPHHALTWNYWTERRFKEHCKDWKVITYAGGAAIGKSFDAAKIAVLFWLANPKKRAVLVMSTTLESLNSRIYGYVCRLLKEMQVALPYTAREGNQPRIEFPADRGESKDKLHCIAAVAAKKGDSDTAISGLIGRHPEEGLMIIADECTDLPLAILDAIPNLSSGVATFQLLGIGNSNSKFDLHGSLSTPKIGWDKVDPKRDSQWETTQDKGICLFFSCYESPAIFETDDKKKKALKKFLVDEETIQLKIKEYGADSESFYRFVLGFWKSDALDEVVLSQKFLSEFKTDQRAMWAGLQKLEYVAGLDPAFSAGGDKCLLRLGILGYTTAGNIVLDFRGEELKFVIPISRTVPLSIELQIADRVLEILKYYNVGLDALCVDATGQGRALAEVIKLRANVLETPIKIYSVQTGAKSVNSFDVQIRTPIEMWNAFRDFIQHGQIRGLDAECMYQLTTRLVEIKNGKRVLESKSKYKARMKAILPSMAHSPDEADAAALCIQAAMLRFGFVTGQRVAVATYEDSFIGRKIQAWVEGKGNGHIGDIGGEADIEAGFSRSLEDLAFNKLL